MGGIPRKQTSWFDKIVGPPGFSEGLNGETIDPGIYVDMADFPQRGVFLQPAGSQESNLSDLSQVSHPPQRYFISFFFDSSNTDTPSWGMGNAIVVVVSHCRFTEFLCNAEAKIKEQKGLADVRIIHYQKVEPGDWLPEE